MRKTKRTCFRKAHEYILYDTLKSHLRKHVSTSSDIRQHHTNDMQMEYFWMIRSTKSMSKYRNLYQILFTQHTTQEIKLVQWNFEHNIQ